MTETIEVITSRPESSFANSSTKVLRNVSIAGALVFVGFAVAAEMIDTTTTTSTGNATLAEIHPSYDLTQLEFDEIALGYATDDRGPLGVSEAWANVEGVAQKEFLLRPPFPVRTEVREDQLGKYIYVFMQDENGRDIAFDFTNMAVSVDGMQPCANNSSQSGTSMQDGLTFPDCPDPSSDEWRGAISAKAIDGNLFFENPDIANDAYSAADTATFGSYCMENLLGQSNPLDEKEAKTMLPNPKKSYNRLQAIGFTNFRDQIIAGYDIAAHDEYGLPTVRFQHEEAAIQDIIKTQGIDSFSDSENLPRLMESYQDYDNTLAVAATGKPHEVNIGPSYGAQLVELQKTKTHIDLADFEKAPTPDTSRINYWPCLAPLLLVPEEGTRFQQMLDHTAEMGSNHGVPLKKADGTFMTAQDLDTKLTLIAGGNIKPTVSNTASVPSAVTTTSVPAMGGVTPRGGG